uniref:Uncharacterized protein n=1 Tax=viral metagenome TaxID=1070528 RepID=A0A6M3XXN9_9ZZZZ
MNRDAKRISISLRPEIELTKSNIRNTNGHGFCGTGYVFKKALSELRKSGAVIVFDKNVCSYFITN